MEDGKYETLTEAPKPAVFFPILQDYSSTIVLMARFRWPEPELAAEMRETIGRLDPHLAIYGIGSLHQMLGWFTFRCTQPWWRWARSACWR